MKGIARIAITIISQSRCLRSNFIITGKIVAAAKLSRKCVEKSQIPSSKTQEDPKRQMLKSIAHHPFGIWDFVLQIVSRFLNQFPSLAQIFLSREHVTQANSHYRPIA